MRFNMLLQILWAFECLAAKVAFVGFEWNVNTNVRGNMISLHRGGTATSPLTRQVEIVGALATNMTLADMFLQKVV